MILLRRWGVVALAAMALSGCETTADKGPSNAELDHATCIGEWGMELGTQGYAQCRAALAQIRLERERTESARNAAMIDLGTSMLGGGAPPFGAPRSDTGLDASRDVGFLRNSYTSGMNKICVYETIQGDVARNFKLTDICPITLP